MSEHVLVIGAGIAGLCTALALAPTGRRVTLVERDDAPPVGDADHAFKEWNRRGVGHLRHSHAFLARLRTIIRDEHPQLLADLLAAGCREIRFEDMLTDLAKETYTPAPLDGDMVILTSRRTTLELVIRRYVERQSNVEIRSRVFVRGLLTHRDDQGRIVVTGASTDEAGDLHADVVVEAGGKGATLIEGLMEAGAPIREESESAGILYFTRHYRLRPGAAEPPRGKIPASGDLGFLKFGVFPADNGCFSITLCAPEPEIALRQALLRPETFDAVCGLLPGLVPWMEPERSEPVSKVFGMGDLHSRWRDLAPDGRPAVLGFFAVGDALVRTNPLYGRGCSFAAVGGQLLRRALDTSADPARRLLDFQTAVQRELHPYYLSMRTQDRSAVRRARAALTTGYRPKLKARLAKSFLEDGVNIAVRADPALMREALRGFHMLEHPDAWLKRPANMAKVIGWWAKPRRAKAHAYPQKPGPNREQLLRAIGVPPEADMLAA